MVLALIEEMLQLSSIIVLVVASTPLVLAQSNLLESVKKNPKEAISLCNQFRDLNSKGISASSEENLSKLSKQRNLSKVDAEIFSTYVIGLHCPEVS